MYLIFEAHRPNEGLIVSSPVHRQCCSSVLLRNLAVALMAAGKAADSAVDLNAAGYLLLVRQQQQVHLHLSHPTLYLAPAQVAAPLPPSHVVLYPRKQAGPPY